MEGINEEFEDEITPAEDTYRVKASISRDYTVEIAVKITGAGEDVRAVTFTKIAGSVTNFMKEFQAAITTLGDLANCGAPS